MTLDRCDACLDVLVLGRLGPVECAAGIVCDLLEEVALRSSVAFAERMDSVDLGEVSGQAADEVGAGKPAEVILGGEVREELGRLLLDVLGSALRMRACEFAGADLAGPRVYVLEDGAVERLEVGEVVATGQSMHADRLLTKE